MLKDLEDLFYLVAGAIACFSPVALIVVLVVQSRRIRQLRETVQRQEEGLRSLGDQSLRLHRRLQAVEHAPSTDAPAPAAFVAPEPSAQLGPVPEETAARVAPAPPPQAPLGWASVPDVASPEPAKEPAVSPPEPSRWAPTGGSPPEPPAEGGPPSPGPPSPPLAPPRAPEPNPPPEPRAIAWEEWIGVRGAAALGGIVLVIAGLYFFKYSMDHGWIAPAFRFAIGMLVGLGCVALAELRLRPNYEVAAGWVTGAGIGVLYIASWAGRSLYDLYPSSMAATLMIAVTAACVVLSLRHGSLAIAILGLCGGFVTPLALSTGSDHPLPLFGYLLGLDAAILLVAVRRRWTWLAGLALAATLFYEVGWVLLRMDGKRRWIGAVVLVLFGLLFALVPQPASNEGRTTSPGWRWIRTAALLAPCLLALVLGFTSDLGTHALVTGLQSIALAAGAAFVGRRSGMSGLPVAAALTLQGSLVGTLVRHVDTPGTAWALAAIALGVVCAFQVALEIGDEEARDNATGGALAAGLAAIGLGYVAMGAPSMATGASATLFVVGSAFVCRTVCRTGARPAWHRLSAAALPFAGVGLALLFAQRSGDPVALLEPTTNLGLLLGAAFAAQLAGVLPKAPVARRFGDLGASIVALLFMVAIAALRRPDLHPLAAVYGASWLALLAAVFAAARSGLGPMLVVAGLVAAGCDLALAADGEQGRALLLGTMVGQVLLLLAAPFAFPRLGSSPWAWRAAGAFGALVLLPLRLVYVDLFGAATQGLLPLGLAALYLLATFALRRRPPVEGAQLSARIWLIGAAAALITVAIPMQLEKEWITIGWALQVVVFGWLWRRYDHPGLKYTAAGLALAVFVRLALNPDVLDYRLRSAWRVFNWISYTYLVPAAALLGAYALMKGLEVPRRRPWEPGPEGRPLVAPTFAAMAIVLIFLWSNLMVFDFFATGPNLTIPTERMPARDLTTSIVWALFALGLLTTGLLRHTKGLRYASLALLLLTCLKVFLYDLGNLQDLYRVASLAGLALTLIVISLVYKRFVFADGGPRHPAPEGPPP